MIKHEIADLVPDIARGWAFTDLTKIPPRLHMIAVTTKRTIALTFVFLFFTTKTPLLQNFLINHTSFILNKQAAKVSSPYLLYLRINLVLRFIVVV